MNINYFEGGAEIYHDGGVMSVSEAELDDLFEKIKQHRSIGDDHHAIQRVMSEVIRENDSEDRTPTSAKVWYIKLTRQRMAELGYELPDLRALKETYEEMVQS